VNNAEKKVQIIQQHMRAAQSRQKSDADKRRRPLEFKVGDYVYCWVFLTSLPKVDSFVILVTVPKMSNLSLIPLKPSCHPQHDMRDAIFKYAIALLNK